MTDPMLLVGCLLLNLDPSYPMAHDAHPCCIHLQFSARNDQMLPAIHLSKYGSVIQPVRLSDQQTSQMYYNGLLNASDKMANM